MNDEINKLLYWTPRILAILFICFITLFSLDIFDMNLDFWGTVVGLLIHNIPTFILLFLLIISWRYELVGAILFILFGIVFAILILINAILSGFSLILLLSSVGGIGGPILLIGILFLISWRKK
ncbi:MAG: hypothetical protein EU533_02670 [Promethearchaeota archaeon]|nr:MAG: hypothetical protein EU533_02670 [Candidatus Lokiarchaeota archaeon]